MALAYIFLGKIPEKGIKFKAPGATHHARFLAKAIYSLKIFLFQKQMNLEAWEEKALRSVCIFIVKFYVKAWFTAPLPTHAANTDFSLLKNLYSYEKTDKQVSETVRSKLLNHLWYCSEELIGISLFDDSVAKETKINMVKAMRERESVSKYSKRLIINTKEVKKMFHKDISQFASKKSLLLFDQFGLKGDFLDLDIDSWENNIDYILAKQIITNIKVVNDIAERGVGLIEQFNQCITKDEDQLQFLLQVVQMNRQRIPDGNKKTFTAIDVSDEWWFN